MSPMPRNPFRGGVRSLAKTLASCALAVSVAAGPALGAAAVLGAGALALTPQQSWAEPVRQGDFLIEGDASKYSYVDGVLTVKDGADLTISTSGKTSNRIVVEENAEATITLNGVSIEGASAASAGDDPVSAIDVRDNASLLLQLADDSTNTLVGGSDNISSNGVAGIHVPKKAELAILGAGSLTVTGGDSHSGYAGSGIGGNAPSGPDVRGEACGTVVILATGNVEISGGKGMNEDSNGDDIGGGQAPPQSGGDADDGGGIRPTDDGNYVVWGEPTLPNPPSSYTISEGTTLTVPGDAALCIPSGVTLINNGTITGEGNLNGDGILTGSGVVTVGTNNFQKDSVLTLSIEGAGQASSGDMYAIDYGSQITLNAEIKKANKRALSAGDYNTVTFYVGDGDSRTELGTVKVRDDKASLPLTLSGDTWNKGFKVNSNNTITAEFTGHSHLKPTAGAVTLWVSKGPCVDPPEAPGDASNITATSVTLMPVTGSDGKGSIQYGYTTGTMDRPYTWQSSPTFENLTPATAYTFYARYAENDLYKPSASSDTGLNVITAPADDAVTIDYINETIHYADTIEVSPDQNFNASFHSGGSITSYIAGRMYMRVAVQGDGDAPLRGVTTIELPLRPGSTEEPKSLSASGEGERDGKIVNLESNAAYQISADSQTTWMDRTTDANGVISGLAAGTYWVRTKATPTQFAGAADAVTVGAGDAITIIPPTFEPVYVGYDQPDPMRFTILNNSDKDVTMVNLSKTAGEAFTVQGVVNPSFTVPAGGSNTSFTVQPGEGWAPGVHTATITVEYGNGQLAEAEVSFTVFPRMYAAVRSEVEPEEGDKDWAPTVTYGNELVVLFETSGEPDNGMEEPGEEDLSEEVPGEKAALGPDANEGSDDSPAVPMAKGGVSLYLGDELLAGPVAYEGGDIALTYDTRKRGIPVSEKKQELTVVFEGENAPDKTETVKFKLEKAPAAELTVSGDYVEGATLEAGFPDARDNAGASFQWLRDGEPIAGATGRSYRLAAADVGHEVTVRATSPWFEGVSASVASGDAVKPAVPSSGEKPVPGGSSATKPSLPATGDPAALIASAAITGAALLLAGSRSARKRR